MMKKLSLAFLSIVVGILVFDYVGLERVVCDTYSCSGKVDGFLQVFFFTSLLSLFFLVIIKFLPENSFRLWWSFAKYALPLIVAILLVINLELFRGQTAGMGGWGSFMRDAANLYITLFVYSVFILGSLVAIFRGWRSN